MLKFIRGREFSMFPRLRDSMFRDRAIQFRERLGWEVNVDSNGWERDQYDALDPLYVVWELPDGTHGGSMRFLPTTGRTMVNEHFAHLLPAGRIASGTMWECTRFCLSGNAGASVSTALMLGGAEVGVSNGLRHAVGVFDARMVRIYRLLGWSPDIIGATGTGRDMIGVGLWSFSEGIRQELAARAGIPADLSRSWYMQSQTVEAVAA